MSLGGNVGSTTGNAVAGQRPVMRVGLGKINTEGSPMKTLPSNTEEKQKAENTVLS